MQQVWARVLAARTSCCPPVSRVLKPVQALSSPEASVRWEVMLLPT